MSIDLDYFKPSFFLAGCDEVGRGPLAGPVVAASCVGNFQDKEMLKNIVDQCKSLGVQDSKKLTIKKREAIINEFGYSLEELKTEENLKLHFRKNIFLKIRIVEISNEWIDKVNILNASLEAMKRSLDDLSCSGTILVDGNKLLKNLPENIVQHAIVKGDSKSVLIALASIFAKVYRDFLMEKFSVIYPGYGFEKHAGYPTKFHKKSISEQGPCKIHRRTFKGVKEHLSL